MFLVPRDAFGLSALCDMFVEQCELTLVQAALNLALGGLLHPASQRRTRLGTARPTHWTIIGTGNLWTIISAQHNYLDCADSPCYSAMS